MNLSDSFTSNGEDYTEGEKVLAYHQSLIYEAKILQVEERQNHTKSTKFYYLIHYQGWNDSWDEWVDSSRIMKNNEENKRIQEELKIEYRKLSSTKKTNRRLNHAEKVVDIKCKIEIPISLKKKLVSDSENITQQKYLVSLPRRPNVTDIFQGYIEYSKTVEEPSPHFFEVVSNMKSYFDKSLGSFLLYRFERKQYSEILSWHPGKDMSDIYGIEHLLRLFVKLPQLLSAVEMEDEALQSIKTFAIDFLKYIQNNLSSFAPSYEPATAEYIRFAI